MNEYLLLAIIYFIFIYVISYKCYKQYCNNTNNNITNNNNNITNNNNINTNNVLT